MNLTKIVNEINNNKKVIRKYDNEGKFAGNEINFNQEIHLEDLLLAIEKIGTDYIISTKGFIQVFENNFWEELCKIDLKNPISKQKPEVIKKLIEILS